MHECIPNLSSTSIITGTCDPLRGIVIPLTTASSPCLPRGVWYRLISRRPSRGQRLMQLARFVRTMVALLMLGPAGLGGGCGAGSPGPASQEESEKIRESKKKAHQQIQEQ